MCLSFPEVKMRRKLILRLSLLSLLLLIVAMFAYPAVSNYFSDVPTYYPVILTGPDENYTMESSPLYDWVEQQMPPGSLMRHRHIGWCGTPGASMEYTAQAWISEAPVSHMIPLLQHISPFLRSAIHERLKELGDNAMATIKDAYENGSPRLKLELIQYVNSTASPEFVFELLDDVINDNDNPVFFEDSDYFRLMSPNSCPRPGLKPSDYPFDILKYYSRLICEAEFPTDRGIAAMRLGDFGPDAESTIPYILELFEQLDEYIETWWGFYNEMSTDSLHAAAAIALGDIGVASDEVISVLEFQMESSHIRIKAAAASSLYLIGERQDEILDLLVQLLNNREAELSDSEYDEDMYYPVICEHLLRIGDDASIALPRFYELMENTEGLSRTAAITAINALESEDKRGVKLFMAILSHPDPDLRSYAIDELWRSYRNEKGVLDALYNMLGDPDVNVKWQACLELWNYGYGGPLREDTSSLVKATLELLNGDPDNSHARDVLQMLGSLDICLPEAIPGILNLMGEYEGGAVQGAIFAIQNVNCDEIDVDDMILEKIIECTVHNDQETRRTMGFIIDHVEEMTPVDPERAMYHYRQLLENDPDIMENVGFLYGAASHIINEVTSTDEDIITNMMALLDSRHEGITVQVAEKIGQLEGNYDRVIDKILVMLTDNDPLVREIACKVCEELGPEASEALPILREMYMNDPDVKWDAYSAMNKVK